MNKAIMVSFLLLLGCAKPGFETPIPRAEGYDRSGAKALCEVPHEVMACPLSYDLWWDDCTNAGYELVDCNGCNYLCSGPAPQTPQ